MTVVEDKPAEEKPAPERKCRRPSYLNDEPVSNDDIWPPVDDAPKASGDDEAWPPVDDVPAQPAEEEVQPEPEPEPQPVEEVKEVIHPPSDPLPGFVNYLDLSRK